MEVDWFLVVVGKKYLNMRFQKLSKESLQLFFEKNVIFISRYEDCYNAKCPQQWSLGY